jgi:hypothetical protein
MHVRNRQRDIDIFLHLYQIITFIQPGKSDVLVNKPISTMHTAVWKLSQSGPSQGNCLGRMKKKDGLLHSCSESTYAVNFAASTQTFSLQGLVSASSLSARKISPTKNPPIQAGGVATSYFPGGLPPKYRWS